jgi:hypothetical protein
MIRKTAIFFVVFCTSLLLNFSARNLQEQYDKRALDFNKKNTVIIEMLDASVVHYLDAVVFPGLWLDRLTDAGEPGCFLNSHGAGKTVRMSFSTVTRGIIGVKIIHFITLYQGLLPPGTFVIT